MPLSGRDKLLATFADQRDALLRFLRRKLDNAALAEDLAQETWLRAAGAAGATVIDNPRGYLFRIAANLALDHQRRAGQRIELPGNEPAMLAVADPMPSPEIVALHRSELARLIQVIDGLSPRAREVFVLAKFDGFSHAEIAARLGIARSTVVTHLTNALIAIERAVGPERR